MDMKDITLVKSDIIPDWCIIEWYEHDGREWFEKTGPNSSSFRRSARVSDAEVEGTNVEMIEIAKAIVEKREVEFRRCAVDARDHSAIKLWSPRNSGTPATVNYDNCCRFLIEAALMDCAWYRGGL